MTIPYCVQIAQPSPLAENIISSTFAEINAIYNNWNPHSEISKLNTLKAFEKQQLSPELYSFLQFTNSIVRLTEGRFDPTVASLHQLWKKSLKENHLPSEIELQNLSPAIGWDKIHLEEGHFWKEQDATTLDLCGIAKGYAVDLITERLQAAGLRDIYVEWGGEIRTSGNHPDNRPWKIGIIGLIPLELKNEAIATSGSYIQQWTIDSITYTHIIDPRTQKPLNNAPITSATVIAPTCAEADALATAFMLFPTCAEAQSWAQNHGISLYLW